tara:strand:- start:495 stop:1091 length:597 start_codon:yes stop_codon:yes gene_type:complete
MKQNRRSFLKQSAAAVSAASIGVGGADDQSPSAEHDRELDEKMLRAIGNAVLPESIGETGRELAVEAFELWLSEFEPVAELTHPYGGSEIPYGPADPVPGWSAQIEALDLLSRAKWNTGFVNLTNQKRRELLGEQMDESSDTSFPSPGRAHHVGTALMAHYFTSADAVDRCYQMRIAKLECRSIGNVENRPEPLRGSM